MQKDSKKELTLFENSDTSDEEADYTDMFKSHPHFEGKKGEKVTFFFNTVQSTYINILYIDLSLYRHVFGKVYNIIREKCYKICIFAYDT